jgi:hypothetical protein
VEFKESELKNPVFKLGMTFQTGKLFKEAIREYSIHSGKAIHFKKNDPNRVCAEHPNCNWTCFASLSRRTGMFIVCLRIV